MLRFLKQMLQLVLQPRQGWEDVAIGAAPPRHTLTHGLLPLAGLAALTTYFGLIYELHPSFGHATALAVVNFAKYAGTYFVAVALLSAVIPFISLNGSANRPRIETFCACCVGLMTLCGILENLLPTELTLLQFMPLYFIGVMVLGREYLNVDENNVFRFVALDIIALIVPVYAIGYVLSKAL